MTRTPALIEHAVLGWAICGGTIALGRLLVPIPTVLIVHAIVAPIAFALLSPHFFRGYAGIPPLRTSLVMVGIVIGLDGLVVAPFIEQSYAMFASPLGTWIPFASIWLASFLTGRTCRQRRYAC